MWPWTSAICCGVHATPLIYNTNQVVQQGTYYAIYTGQSVAAPFVTGPSAASLDSVTFYEVSLNVPTGTFHLSIYSDNSGVPGSILPGGGLNGASNPLATGYLTYTTGGPLTLAATTHYWVVASSDAPGGFLNQYGWFQAPSSSFVSPVGWSYTAPSGASHDFSLDHGSTWFDSPGTLLMAIDGTLVPEPSAFVFLCLACAVALRRLANESATARSDPTSGRASV